MLKEYFGFTSKPFAGFIKEVELFGWKEFNSLKSRLEYFLSERGIFLLTGAIGSGKTTALRQFAMSLNPNIHFMAYSNQALESKKDFHRTVSTLLGIKPLFYLGDCRNQLRQHIQELYFVKKITPILVLDEARDLPGYVLEEIRLLSNFDFESQNPILIILSGHKLLRQRMASLENEALRQRVTIRYHMEGLDLEECSGYIRHRLNLAGSTAAIFSDQVLPKIFEESGGVIRIINRICTALLLAAETYGKKFADEALFSKTQEEWK